MKTNMINTNSVIKSICAVVMLLGMSVSAWGANTATINFGNSTGYTQIDDYSVNGYDDKGNTWSVTTVTSKSKSFTQQPTYSQVGSGSNPVTSITFEMTLPASKTISAFSAKFGGFSGTAGTVTLKVGDTSVGSGSLNEGTDVTISNSSTAAGTKLQVTVTSISKGVKCYYISCTYGNASAYKVTFDAEGGTCATGSLTEGSPDAGVTLPAASPSASMADMGWGFYGWAESAVASPTTTAPTIVGKAGDTYYPQSATTLHAVFAKGEYTKVTSTSEITVGSGEKYLIMGYDDNCSDEGCGIYAMTHESFIDGSDNEYMYGYRLGDAPSATYSAAAVRAEWRYEMETSTTYYYFKNTATSKYVDTDNATKRIYTSTKTAADKYIITFSSNGYCTIKNNSTYYSNPYLNVFDGDGSFSNGSSGWEKMMIYKETTSPMYCSAPKTVKVVASPAEGGLVDLDIVSAQEYVFSDDDYEDFAEAAENSGYEFLRWETSNATNAKFYDGAAYTLTTSTDATAQFKATGDATLTAYFYKNCSVTYTLTGLTKLTGVTNVDAATNASGFTATFSVNDHYRTTPLTCSVTMGGSPLTEGSGNDYTWNASTKTLTIPAATDITGDLVITISAEHTEYTKYAFSCAELTLTPHLATTGTPIFITSTASKTVRSQDYIEITGNGLTPSTELTFPGLPSKFAIKNADGTAVTTDGNGEISTNAYIFYTPDAGDTSDGLDKLTGITVSVGGAKPQTVNLTQDIIGRHLPADFVIAAKKDGKWWAMPSNMSSTTNPTPVEISVDNATNPSIAYTLSNTYYGLAGPTAANISGGNGQYIRFAMSIDDGTLDPHAAPLFGNSTGSTTLGKSNNSQISSDLSAGNWWKLVQTNTSITNPQDAKYTIYCANNTQSLTLEDGGKWGLYATNGTDVDELRLVPARSGVSYEEAEIVEWGQHGAIVEVDTHLGYHTKVKAKLNGAETGFITLSQTKTSVSKVDTKYNYTVNFGDGIDFAAAASNGAMLTLEWYNTSEVLQSVSNITVPKIIASSATMSSIESGDTPWSKWEVHVLPGVTLDANAGSFSSSDVVINNLQLYPGAILKVTTGTLVVTNLSLRNGWRRVGVAEPVYAAPRIQIKTTANLRHTNAYLDWYIDNDQFYPVAVPFPVKVSTITYLNTNNSVTVGGTSGVIRLRYFDGENRAAGNSGNWKYYGAVGCTAVPDTLKPSMGYALAAMRPGGKAFSILRMPLIYTDEWTALGEQASVVIEAKTYRKDTVHVYAYGTGQTAEWNKGWNLIGNPYMSVFNGNDDGISGKLLYVTNVDDPKKDKVRYVTIPNSSFTDYSQVNITEANIRPFSSFLIQAKDTSAISFSKSKIEIPSAPAHYTATPASLPEQEVYIHLSNEEASDQMGLIIGEDYTAEYETDADLAKMHGELNTLKTYMVYDNVDMAYVAINEQLAQEWIPVTVRIPESGQYTFSMRSISVVDELEGVYLIDYSNGQVTNLIENDYSFITSSGTISGRFAINAIMGERQTPTDIDIIQGGGDINSEQPFKFLYHDKVFIYHRGVIYDATGKKVREINK